MFKTYRCSVLTIEAGPNNKLYDYGSRSMSSKLVSVPPVVKLEMFRLFYCSNSLGLRLRYGIFLTATAATATTTTTGRASLNPTTGSCCCAHQCEWKGESTRVAGANRISAHRIDAASCGRGLARADVAVGDRL